MFFSSFTHKPIADGKPSSRQYTQDVKRFDDMSLEEAAANMDENRALHKKWEEGRKKRSDEMWQTLLKHANKDRPANEQLQLSSPSPAERL